MGVIAKLIQWAYGIWPSYGVATVLASLAVSVLLMPLRILEMRSHWRVTGGVRPTTDGEDTFSVFQRGESVFFHRDLFRGSHLALVCTRLAILLASAIIFLLTVIGLTHVDPANGGGPRYLDQRSTLWLSLKLSRGEMNLGWIDLGKSAFTVGATQGSSAVGAYLVVPIIFVIIYVLVSAKFAVVRKLNTFVALSMSLLVPGAFVLYLLTMLLFNFVLFKSIFGMARLQRRVTDTPLPPNIRQSAVRGLWAGWVFCVTGVVSTVVGVYSIVTSLPADLESITLGRVIDSFGPGGVWEWLGILAFIEGEDLRWTAQLVLSRAAAYRRAHGFSDSSGSLSALRRSKSMRSSRRLHSGWMSHAGGLVCGIGWWSIVIGLRYLWNFATTSRDVAWWKFAVLLGLGISSMAIGNSLLRGGLRQVQRIISSPKDLAAGSYVLYLRSFGEDDKLSRLYRFPRPNTLVRGIFSAGRTQEQWIADALAWAGLPVGMGRPGERIPHTGIQRAYLPLHDWQKPVLEMIRNARLVVILLGPGPGLLWELGEAMRSLPPQRLVLLVPMRRQEYEAYREMVGTHLREQAEVMRRETGVRWSPPALPDYAGEGIAISRIRGLIHFGPTWEVVFMPLERPPIVEYQLMGALDRTMWSAMVQLTDYEQQTGKSYG